MNTPDWSFVKKLKGVDPKLTAVWNKPKCRWHIYRLVPELRYQGSWRGIRLSSVEEVPYWIMEIKNPDGSFRPLDDRTIRRLHEIDTWKYRSPAEYSRHLEELQKTSQERIDKEIHQDNIDRLKDIPKGNWDVIMDNFRSGRLNEPPKEKEKKVVANVNGMTLKGA